MEKLVPISQLARSPANARRTQKLIDIDVLAAQIKSQGLLQKLLVREKAEDRFEIVDGGRRHAAIKLLIRSGDWPKSEPVPIKILSDDQQDLEVSLAANLGRVDMHPADTFEAFRRLADQEGATPDLIGLRFGYAASTVRGFLKLANCSPRLMNAFRRDEVTLDQMKALSLTDDHKRQDAAFFGVPAHFRSPRELRRRVTEGKVDGADQFVRFVGLPAYEKAGGSSTRDLFGEDNDVFIDDPALLHRLVAEKLEARAAAFREQGWKWVEVIPDLSGADFHSLGQVSQHAHGFKPDSPAARLYAGVVLGVERDGGLKAATGLLRPEDAKALTKARSATKKSGDQPPDGQINSGGAQLSAPVIEELTAIRTMALRAELAARPELALAGIVHDLAIIVFRSASVWDRALTEVRGDVVAAEARIAAAASDKATLSISARVERWRARLPDKASELWPWVTAQKQAVLIELLAVLVAAHINAIQFRHEKRRPPRLAAADRLARSLDLDMTRWWRPDEEFFARLTKSAILAAIAEGVSPEIARSLDRGKKSELAAVAARKLAKTSWLPAPLRTPDISAAAEPDESQESAGEEEEVDDESEDRDALERVAAE